MPMESRATAALPPHVVCTLFEGEYARGATVLVNSLIASGFEGYLCLGYRGELLDCVTQMVQRLHREDRFNIEPELIPVDTERHFTMHKPHFLLELHERLGDRAEKFWYFDPDIVVRKPWADFVEWAQYGVSLCENMNSPLHRDHYKRMQWKNFTSDTPLRWKKDRDIYFNAGFVGVSGKFMRVARVWKQVIEELEERGLGHSAENEGIKLSEERAGENHPFEALDQDALNVATSCYSGPICPLEKRGMGFAPGKEWMGHATGPEKPWNARYVYRALRGRGVGDAHRLYWKHASSPFPAHAAGKIAFSRFRTTVARVLHRIL